MVHRTGIEPVTYGLENEISVFCKLLFFKVFINNFGKLITFLASVFFVDFRSFSGARGHFGGHF
jgi:hypothetical protein